MVGTNSDGGKHFDVFWLIGNDHDVARRTAQWSISNLGQVTVRGSRKCKRSPNQLRFSRLKSGVSGRRDHVGRRDGRELRELRGFEDVDGREAARRSRKAGGRAPQALRQLGHVEG